MTKINYFSPSEQ